MREEPNYKRTWGKTKLNGRFLYYLNPLIIYLIFFILLLIKTIAKFTTYTVLLIRLLLTTFNICIFDSCHITSDFSAFF